MPQMRFLHYEKDGFLAPHTDLSRRDWRTGQRTTHTFILYLHGEGGETVLLESLQGEELVKAMSHIKDDFLGKGLSASRPIAAVPS